MVRVSVATVKIVAGLPEQFCKTMADLTLCRDVLDARLVHSLWLEAYVTGPGNHQNVQSHFESAHCAAKDGVLFALIHGLHEGE